MYKYTYLPSQSFQNRNCQSYSTGLNSKTTSNMQLHASLSFIFIALAGIFGFVGVSRGRSGGRPTLAAAVGLALTALALLTGLLVTVTRFS